MNRLTHQPLASFTILFVCATSLPFAATFAHEGHAKRDRLKRQAVAASAPLIAAADAPVPAQATAQGPVQETAQPVQQESAQAPANAQPKLTATGVVFEDLDRDSVRDPNEPGLPGVRVSNGSDIVKTDANGAYSLPIDDDEIIFVIKPRDFMTPVDEDQLPKFYYIHKPAGSPENFQYKGVAPTGPLPQSIDFPLVRRPEPDKFRALLFGDTQPRNVAEVEYMAHDVIEQVIENKAHGASLGVTLGDIVFDDLDVMQPHNRAIALIGIPWYNVIGNHDMNYDAKDDTQSDETFERHYGPNYYSFDHGPTHFLVLDDVTWIGEKDGKPGNYVGGFGERQMAYIRNDLAMIPEDQLVVLMMHIPLTDVQDRKELYRLIEKRPATVSLSAHAHYMEHRFIDDKDGWQGPEKHHHIINVTVCGSWWRGRKDERGIPHAMMSDGGPNGYSVMEFDGTKYSLDFFAASRPANYQMNIYAAEAIKQPDTASASMVVNVFAASERARVVARLADQGDGAWEPLERFSAADPAFLAEAEREASAGKIDWEPLPKPQVTPHLWRGKLPTFPGPGTHVIEVRSTEPNGKSVLGRRVIRVE